jgi:hypothetical protein
MAVMSSKPQRSVREDRDEAAENESGKTVIRVKRGALRRFDQLTRKSADLPVDVKWDRRLSERRSEAPPETNERRRRDRRQTPPFTWDAAEFLVEGEHSGQEPAPVTSRPRRSKTDNNGN